MNEKVTTVSGETTDRANCRKIKNEFYKIGVNSIEHSGDVYKINEKFYRQNTGYIIYDHTVKSYVLKAEATADATKFISNGVVDFDGKKPLFGFFTTESHKVRYPQIRYKNSHYYAFSEDMLREHGYIEVKKTGIFSHRSAMPAHEFYAIATCNQEDKHNLNYDCRQGLNHYIKLYNENYDPVFSKAVARLDNEGVNTTGDLTFGLEFETVDGIIPPRELLKTAAIPLRDGSINGLEYVTVPLHGNVGLQNLLDIVDNLNNYTLYDQSCSLHCHVGNIPRTEEFLLATYKVLYLLQDEIYELFPHYKKVPCGVKRKHYTKPLPTNLMLKMNNVIGTPLQVKKNFAKLFKFLSMGYTYGDFANNDLKNVNYHPSDSNGTSKWNIKTRYYWVNLIPLLFGNKQTIEFRIHTPTYNKQKIMNFLLMSTSIIQYVKDNTSTILKGGDAFIDNLDLQYIVQAVYGRDDTKVMKQVRNELLHYLSKRRSFFTQRLKNGEVAVKEEEFIYAPYYFNWNTGNGKVKTSSPYKSFNINPDGWFHNAVADEVVAGGWHQFGGNINIDHPPQVAGDGILAQMEAANAAVGNDQEVDVQAILDELNANNNG